ncbi:AtpZ/AtpI family protein [Rhodospirillaceae bacterium SYSU D60014]|uniref:AtpZ/AtpI family protein n=1 Tax=Virgifigura deserti TaxID=2268457 RepID=UPI000E66E9F7
MTEDKPPPPKDFETRLRDLRKRTSQDQGDRGGPLGVPQTTFGVALRAGVELVAGLVVGGGIGWLLDRWLGTGPFLMVLFFFLGSGAGMLNVFRLARRINRLDPDDRG